MCVGVVTRSRGFGGVASNLIIICIMQCYHGNIIMKKLAKGLPAIFLEGMNKPIIDYYKI